MNAAERLSSVTACAARTLSAPLVTVITLCSHCNEPSGTREVPVSQAHMRFDQMHVACVAAYRAAHFGAPKVAA